MSNMKGEIVQDCTEELIERLHRSCPNLTQEAVEVLASGMVGRVVNNRLASDTEKQERLYQMMKGGSYV